VIARSCRRAEGDVQGDVTVYEARRAVPVCADEGGACRASGALQAAFEKLKQKLKAEGLFRPGKETSAAGAKPASPGLVTSPTGAAIRDVLHVVERRNPPWRLSWRRAVSRGRARRESPPLFGLLMSSTRPNGRRRRGLAMEPYLITRGAQLGGFVGL